MKLLRIARLHWDVLAICDQRGGCQVLSLLEGLQGLEGKAAKNMLAVLRKTVPQSGPHMGERLCKSLGEGVYEFRRQPKGQKLRVLWFYGGTAVIVCTAAFKKAERTPQVQLERARFLRKQYWNARSRNEIAVIDSKEKNLES